MITARAPGKVILSGEHAVVYGKPALALAVNYFATTTISVHAGSGICFRFPDDNIAHILTMQELRESRAVIAKRYLKFIRGKCSIREVIQQPMELLQYGFIYLVDSLELDIPNVEIQLQLTLPIGCGMGASAAVILSMLHAVVSYAHVATNNKELTAEQYLHFGREIENLQHGRSSGLDLFMSLYGGCYFFVDGNVYPYDLPRLPLTLVNTGSAASSTGECVEQVASFLQQASLVDEFARVTNDFVHALKQQDLDTVKRCVKKNHELLLHIGVVPEPVANFINEVTIRGNTAKISGAGAVYGTSAGVVLVFGEADITDIVTKYGYTILPIQGVTNGLCLL